jgi:hypothetical protein
MKTKLEMMVAYLAGRQGETAELIRSELEDPTSEASRCLEAVRSRSRVVFSTDGLEMQDLIPRPSIRNRATAPGVARRRLVPLLFAASSAALVFIAVGTAWRAQNDRLRHLEAIQAQREARWGDRVNRLQAALLKWEAPSRRQTPGSKGPNSPEPTTPTPTDRSTSLALARIEARLGELGQRVGEGQPRQDPDDPRVAQLARDLDRLRQEMEIAGRASKQESQELSLAVREILHILRRLAMHSRAPEPMPVPVPTPFPPQGHEPGMGQGPGMTPRPGPVPGPGQMPGPGQPRLAPGRGNR